MKDITLAVTELRSERKRKAATVEKKRSAGLKKMAQSTTRREKQRQGRRKQRERERKRDRLVFLSRLCGMTSLCTAAVFVNQGQGCLLDNFLREEGGKRGREKKKKKKQEREKEGRELRH